jgi:hypothetical protein
MNGNADDDLDLEGYFQQHRKADPEKLKHEVAKLLEKLAELERSTTPLNGNETAAEKGRKALEALFTAGELVGLLAGWAIDHQVGMALRGINFTPEAPPRNLDHPEYLELCRIVDDHQLERDGQLARWKRLDPRSTRTLLHNLLQANPGAFPHQLQLPVMEALKALDFGEVLPVFEPLPAKYKKARYLRLQLELWAFALVEYRVAEAGGKGRLRAQEDVAAAYGVEANTLRKWEPSLREEFGALELFRMVGNAHTCGTLVAKARKMRISVELGSSYDDAALAEAGREYKALIKIQAMKALKKRGGKKALISFPKK